MSPLFELQLTQEELDHLHLILGFSSSRSALTVLDKIEKNVSEENYNRYDKLKFTFHQEDGIIISEAE